MVYFTVNEVAARLRVTSLTVRRWLRAGSLGGIALGHRAACRIGAKDLEAFLDGRRPGAGRATTAGIVSAHGTTRSARSAVG
jgi:excisionase family DNA binding protein